MFFNRISLASVIAFLGSLTLLLPALTHGQAPAAAQSAQPARLSLSVTPAAEPRPALKYSLWLSDNDLQPGNGATNYYRAMLTKKDRQNDEGMKKQYPPDTIQKWLTVPLVQLPNEDVAKFLNAYQGVFDELQHATTRETCEWNLRLKDLRGTDVVAFLLNDFSEMRSMGQLVALKSRLAVAQGKHDEAIQNLRMGYRIAHDAARPPLLINALIGMAIAGQMNGVALELIDSPNSPNLYWAFKELPRPLIDSRAALAFEMSIPFRMFPFLKDAETAVRSPAEWKKLLDDAIAQLRQVAPLVDEPQAARWKSQFITSGLLLRAYSPAKKALIESGMPADVVEKMPVAQVVVIQAARSNKYAFDEMFKWSLLPYAEARTHMAETEARLTKVGYFGANADGKDALPLAALLMPALSSVLLSSQRADRQFATLETIEAIRMHAAARAGKLPESLQSLDVVPAPMNPFTGRTFDYRLDDQGRAVLEERSPGVDPVRAGDRTYLIELEKAVR